MPSAPPEQVLGAIPNARIKTGHFSSDRYVLVVTDRRLIGAKVTDDLLKRILAEARAETKAAGGGFFRQWAAQIQASFSIERRYAAMAPQAIISETPGNWALDPASVRSIRLERRERDDEDGATTGTFLRITIETAQGSQRFETDTENPGHASARAMLAHTFGPLVR